MLTLDTIQRAPKALLHDHLDGGLRPGDDRGPRGRVRLRRPADDRSRRAGGAGSAAARIARVARAVPRDVRPHGRRHAGARRDHPGRRRMRRGPRGRRRRLRRGPQRARAVHGAGTDARRGHRRQPRGLPDRVGARRRGRPPDRDEDPRDRDAPGGPLGRGRRVRRPLARRRRRRLRHRRPRGRLSPDAPSRRLRPVRRENFHITIHAGESFGLPSIWEALQFCGAERLGPRGPDRRRHHRPRRRDGRARVDWRRSCATDASRSRCARPRTCTPAPRRRSRSTRSTCSVGCASGSRSTPTIG